MARKRKADYSFPTKARLKSTGEMGVVMSMQMYVDDLFYPPMHLTFLDADDQIRMVDESDVEIL